MGIIASFDKHPVYLDNDGNPLASGKIHFYAIGTTTPKTVYSDYTLTTPAANPQICGADGRTPTQIFLGTGEYTCISRKFNGTDPNTAPDTDWDTVTSQWVEEGQPTPSVASLTDAVYVTTIANLRLIDANALSKTNFMVMGYWSEGDMFPRTYHWDALSLLPDNKGTVIKNPSISTGAFILDVGNTDVMDCRIFGIIHNRAASNNAAISAMVTEVQNNAKLPQTIYFPRGIYEVVSGTQYFDTKVIFDDLCQFKNTSGSPYIIGIRDTFENNSISDIQASSSTGSVYFTFSNDADTAEIDFRWYGAKNDGTTDDGPAFEECIANITTNYKLRISSGRLRITTLTQDAVIYNTIRFYDDGQLDLNQSTYKVTFNGEIGTLENRNITSSGTLTGAIYENNLNKYYFVDYPVLKASLIAGDASRYIKAWNANIVSSESQLQPFELDVGLSFGDPLALSESNNFTFKWTHGVSSCNTAAPIHLPNMDAPSNALIFSAIGFYIHNEYTHASWFPSITGAIKSAFAGGSTLDLDGRTYTTSTAINITDANDKVTIKNGEIDLNTTTTWLTLSDSCPFLTFENVYWLTGSTTNNILVLNANVIDLVFKNCTAICWNLSYTNTGTFVYYGTGYAVRLIITDCDVRYGYGLLITSTNVGTVNIHDNTYWQAMSVMNGSSVKFVNNNVYGGANFATVITTGTIPSVISGNSINENYLKIQPNSAGQINHVVTGNAFHTTVNQTTGIIIATTIPSTRMTGLSITGNSFTADTAASAFTAIQPILESAGTWFIGTISSGHVLDISNNTGAIVTHYTNSIPDAWKIKVPRSIGNGIIKFAKSALTYTDVGDSNTIAIAFPADAFVIPGTKSRPYVTGNMYYDWNGTAVHYFMSEKLSFLGSNKTVAEDYFLINVRVDFSVSGIASDEEAAVQINYNLYPEQD